MAVYFERLGEHPCELWTGEITGWVASGSPVGRSVASNQWSERYLGELAGAISITCVANVIDSAPLQNFFCTFLGNFAPYYFGPKSGVAGGDSQRSLGVELLKGQIKKL